MYVPVWMNVMWVMVISLVSRIIMTTCWIFLAWYPPQKVVKLPTITVCLTPYWAFYLVGAHSWDAMLVAATIFASLVVWFSTTIIEVRIGAGANIPCIGLWGIVFCFWYVDIQAMAMSGVLAIEVWSRNVDSNASAWHTFFSRDLSILA